jgi:hypothetical protein
MTVLPTGKLLGADVVNVYTKLTIFVPAVICHVLFVMLFTQRFEFAVEKYPTASEGTIPGLDTVPLYDIPARVVEHVNEFAVGMLAIVYVLSRSNIL